MNPNCLRTSLLPIVATASLLLLQACNHGDDTGTAPVVDTTPPTVPASLVAVAQSATSVQLNWQAATDAGAGVAVTAFIAMAARHPRLSRWQRDTAGDGGRAVLSRHGPVRPTTNYSYAVQPPSTPRIRANVLAGIDCRECHDALRQALAMPPRGLDIRPSNTSCPCRWTRLRAPCPLAVERAFPNLGFNSPVLMLQPSSQQRALVRGGTRVAWCVCSTTSRMSASSRVFIDCLRHDSRSHPAARRGCSAWPSIRTGPPTRVRILSYHGDQQRSAGYRASWNTRPRTVATHWPLVRRKVILQINQPESNHNGGNIMFGAGMACCMPAMGMAGGGGDGHGAIGNGQRLSTLLGKMLRIDVNGTTGSTPYAIPAGNPYRYSERHRCQRRVQQRHRRVDAELPRDLCLWLPQPVALELRQVPPASCGSAMSGQDAWEEVDKVVLGGQLRLALLRGQPHLQQLSRQTTPADRTLLPRSSPSPSMTIRMGMPITGGYVYRGSAIPALNGRYLFSDSGSGQLWEHRTRHHADAGHGCRASPAVPTPFSFAQDPSGELYLVNIGGTLHRPGCGQWQRVASFLRSFLPRAASVPAMPRSLPAAHPVRAEMRGFWSDGAVKARWLGVAGWPEHHCEHRRRFRLPQRHCAGEETSG